MFHPTAMQKPAPATPIRELAAKKLLVKKIVGRVKKAYGGKPTAGYVHWLLKNAKP
jgi:hypothetical protein